MNKLEALFLLGGQTQNGHLSWKVKVRNAVGSRALSTCCCRMGFASPLPLRSLFPRFNYLHLEQKPFVCLLSVYLLLSAALIFSSSTSFPVSLVFSSLPQSPSPRPARRSIGRRKKKSNDASHQPIHSALPHSVSLSKHREERWGGGERVGEERE